MPIAKMHTVTEVDHLLQKVRPVGEALVASLSGVVWMKGIKIV
jgi:hypothetical protein